jgi:mono/diheme cytochrome c family protein
VIDKATGKYQVPIQKEIAAVAADPKLLEPLIELPDLAEMTPLQRGKYLFENTYACAGCHALDGTVKKAPHLNGRWREGPSIISTGESIPFTDAYFQESVLYSQAKLVKGFPPIMPLFAGRLPEKDLLEIRAYLKSL